MWRLKVQTDQAAIKTMSRFENAIDYVDQHRHDSASSLALASDENKVIRIAKCDAFSDVCESIQ